MKRDLSTLADTVYDLIVVGGGIFGICTAWDAALRGLSVALIEQGDFGHATSASHFKVVHGGIRYLQHGDIPRVRESSLERSALLRIAPHLVYPMPFVIPTYGHGLKGQELMRAALAVYDLSTADRNRHIVDPGRKIPRSYMLSQQQTTSLFPNLPTEKLTGAAVFHDGQMYNPARLSLAFVQSAAQAGVTVVNYAEVVRFLSEGNRVTGVAVHDRLEGNTFEQRAFEVRGRMVVNATGPWAKWLLQDGNNLAYRKTPIFSRDAYFIVKRKLVDDHALAIQGMTKDPDALLSRGNRHLFLVPWRDYTLVGVWHVVFDGRPETFTLTEQEVQTFIDEVNAGNPALNLSLDDVSMWNAGLTLFGENEPGATHLSYGKRSILIDHTQEHGLDGLISLIGVRFTTARGMAEQTVDMAMAKLGKSVVQSTTKSERLHGGDFDSFDALVTKVIQASATGEHPAIAIDSAKALVHNHGSHVNAVLGLLKSDQSLAQRIDHAAVLEAEVVHAVREEMAYKLGDVVFRRTDLGTGAKPTAKALARCAEIMAAELGWDQQQMQREIAEVNSRYSAWLA